MFVFSNDILIYNKSWKDNVQHVDIVLKLFEENQVYAKNSKYIDGFVLVNQLLVGQFLQKNW